MSRKYPNAKNAAALKEALASILEQANAVKPGGEESPWYTIGWIRSCAARALGLEHPPEVLS